MNQSVYQEPGVQSRDALTFWPFLCRSKLELPMQYSGGTTGTMAVPDTFIDRFVAFSESSWAPENPRAPLTACPFFNSRTQRGRKSRNNS